MLLALYRIRLRTCKYYMNMVFYCMGISITNGWLLYQRYCEQKHGSKKDQMDLCQFQSNVANALLLDNKEKDTLKRGRPSSSSTPNGPSPTKSVTLQHFLSLLKISDLIELGTFPYSLKSRIGAALARDAIRTLGAANAISNFVWSRREIAFMHLYQISTMNSHIDHDCVLTL